jgi:hypothetical protein
MNTVDIIQLDLFLAELAQARVVARQPRAEQAIRRTLQHQPDAAYLLVQRVLQLESALCAARAEASGTGRGRAARDASRRSGEPAARPQADPWWRQPADAFAGTAVLVRSTGYLLGDGLETFAR